MSHQGPLLEGLFLIDTPITVRLHFYEGFTGGPLYIDFPPGPQDFTEITGSLQGDLVGQNSSTLTLTFPDEWNEVRLGDHLYRVRLGSVAVPAWDQGGVDIPREVTVQEVPEPSTLALAASALVLAVCRKRVFRQPRA